MQLYQLPEQTKDIGLTENPGTTTLYKAIEVLVPKNINIAVKAVYYEIYAAEQNDFSGVYVIQYKSEQDLKNILPNLKANERSAYLAINECLIVPNGRSNQIAAARIDEMTNHYQNKLGAKIIFDRIKNTQYTDLAKDETSSKNEKPKVENRTDYEKITTKEETHFLSKETSKHRLGSITKYVYDSVQKIEKQTNYGVKDGKFVFKYERQYQKDINDSILYETQYSEIPSDHQPEYILNHYQYNFQDSFALMVRSINGLPQDSIFTQYKKDSLQRVLLAIVTEKTIAEDVSYTRLINEYPYTYNAAGRLNEKRRVDFDGTEMEKNLYEYDHNNNLKKAIYSSARFLYIITEIYNSKGQLILAEEKRGDEIIEQSRYKYNSKGNEIEENKFEGSKLFYQYSTVYDAKNRKIKYTMTDVENKRSGIWLYEYDNANRLKYKIDLYWKEDKPENKETIAEIVPGPIEIPPTKAKH